MNTRPLVSVVIPNHDYGRYLGQAVDSVLAQSYAHHEVIVVDDGSTDDSLQVLCGYGERVRWVQQACQGVSIARNRGVQESRGEFLAFLDADDAWAPTKLERQIARFLEEPRLGLVHCGAQLVDDDGRRLESLRDGVAGQVTHDLLLFRRPAVVTGGSGAMVPRRVFEEVGGFDPQLSTSADWDWYYRVGRRYPFGFVPEELVRIRRHHGNMHWNIRVMEHDMLLAYAKAFREADPDLRQLRRRAYWNLHMVLAGSFFRAGLPASFMRHAAMSVWLTPENCASLLGFPGRWWRRWTAARVQAVS